MVGSNEQPLPRARRDGRLEPKVVRALRESHLVLLATASGDGRPATTLVSWLWPVDESRLLLALDRRGLAFRHVTGNPWGAIEVLMGPFVGTLRGSIRLLVERLARAPFPCAAAIFEIEEVRRHDVAGVVVVPPSYAFVPARPQYAETEAAIVDELALLAEHLCADVVSSSRRLPASGARE